MGAKTRARTTEIPAKALYSLKTVAGLLDVPTATLREWVRCGEFPRPHAVVRTVWLYQVSVIDHYIKIGGWPDGVTFRDDRVQGR